MNELFRPISALRGVGEKRAKAYARLGIQTPYDLLFHIPRSYLDFRNPEPVLSAPLDTPCVVEGCITRKLPEQRIRKGLSVFKATATDGESDFTVVFYNNFYAFDALKVGETYRFAGKLTGTLLRREIHSPQYLRADCPVLMKPVYPLTNGLTNPMVQANMRQALELLRREPFDGLPSGIRRQYDLCTLPEALGVVHQPASEPILQEAKRRLAFDALLQLQLGMLMLRNRSRAQTAYTMDPGTDLTPFYASLPFAPTNAQKRSIAEICGDLCRTVPANRLLQGDVGSGKTAVAAAACYFTCKNGFQSALMAPTEILATQHYHTLDGFLSPLGIRVGLLTGSLPAKEKRRIRTALQAGELDVLVGTHALIQKDTVFPALGLVITDEQHRFGVGQRAALAQKGGTPHKLVMSATPIPRTLALIVYGDLDISVLDELPVGRLPIRTYAVTGKLRQRAYGFVRSRMDAGEQAYIVCPMIEEGESDLLAVTSYAEQLRAGEFAAYRVGLLHGKMKPAEKEQVMASFKAGELDLLVCTTVVEVGVDVPNATVMLIENSERFGLSQLHQLRGRVGRGSKQSHCILITDSSSEESRERLRVLSSTTDGFRIAEEDLKLRGPGDFFGSAQHGLPPVHLAELAEDMELVRQTQQAARDILEADPQLRDPVNHALRADVVRLYARNGENGLN